MRIACEFIGWNIQDTVAKTVRHYSTFCKHITFYDNHSTDLSCAVARGEGANIRTFGIPGVLDDGEYIKVKNNCWKGTDYDWVIVCDDDEIIYHPKLSFILEQEKAIGTTIFRTQGFGIYSDSMPIDDWLDITTGVKDDNYSKAIIFDPKAIREIGYVYGSHVCKPYGRIQWSETVLPVLHYHNVGGIERVIARHKEYEPRRQKSPLNMRWGMGSHYAADQEEETRRNYEACLKNSVPLSAAGLY